MAFFTIVTLLFIAILITAWKRFIKSGPIYVNHGVSLKGKTALITGGSSGLGKATAIELAKRQARVIIACRNEVKALRAVEDIKVESGNENISFMKLDVSDLDNVKQFVRHFISKEPRLDIFVNNAGCISLEKTQNGQHGLMFATNVLGPFLLTNLLLPLLEETGSENPTRVVNIASDAYLLSEIDFDNLDPLFDESTSTKTVLSHYTATKLMTIYFTTQLSKQLRAKDPENCDVTVYALHPGTANSNLGETFATRGVLWLILRKLVLSLTARSPYYCSQTVLYCCLEPDIEKYTGGYFSEMKPSELWPHAKDAAIGWKLWRTLENMSQS